MTENKFNWDMSFDEYEALSLVDKLNLWLAIPIEEVKRFYEYDYKSKKIKNLTEKQND